MPFRNETQRTARPDGDSWWIDDNGLLQMSLTISDHFDPVNHSLTLPPPSNKNSASSSSSSSPFSSPAETEIWLDIGVNVKKTTPVGKDFRYLSQKEGVFYIAFEPLLAKYAYHVAMGVKDEGIVDAGLIQLPHMRRRRRGMIFPMAVGDEDNKMAEFHVSALDGCSSLNKQRSGRELAEGGWKGNDIQRIVTKGCGSARRVVKVPTVTLGTLLGTWLGGREVEFMHIDAQGAEMSILRSGGSALKSVRRIMLEAPSPKCITLTEGAATCEEIFKSLDKMGFVPEDAIREDGSTRVGLKRGFSCDDVPWESWNSKCEFDLLFIRSDIPS